MTARYLIPNTTGLTLADLIAEARKLVATDPTLADDAQEIISYVKCEIDDEGSEAHEVEMAMDDLRRLAAGD